MVFYLLFNYLFDRKYYQALLPYTDKFLFQNEILDSNLYTIQKLVFEKRFHPNKNPLITMIEKWQIHCIVTSYYGY